MLILKTLALEPLHGYGIGVRLEQMSRGAFHVNARSLVEVKSSFHGAAATSSTVDCDLIVPPLPALVAITAAAMGLLFHLYVIALPTATLTARYLADDYFYFLNVAHNIASGSGSSFDGGITSTNGYQPLFLVTLVLVFASGVSKVAAIHVGLAIQAVAMASAAWPAYRMLAVREMPWAGALVAGVISTNLFFVLHTLTGFELALALALLLWAMWCWESRRPPVVIGMLCGLAVLARVDLIVVPGVFGLVLLRHRRLRDAVNLGVACVVVLLPWVIWSTLRFGSPFPDSGFIKAHYVGAPAVGRALATSFDAAPRLIVPGGLVDRLRDAQTIVLAVIATLLLAAAASQAWRRGNRWIAVIGGLIAAAYLLLIGASEPGALVRYLFPAWTLLLLLAVQVRRVQRPWIVLPIVVWHLFDIGGYVLWERTAPAPVTYVGVAHVVMPNVIARFDPSMYVASFDTGALGYFAQRPVLNLDGLANHEIVELRRQCQRPYSDCLLDYFQRRNIGMLIGGTAFGWTAHFPAWQTWERLYESPPLADGSTIVVIRVP
jgi:hypothetical protein